MKDKKNLKILSLNLGLFNFQICGISFFKPTKHISKRLKYIPKEIIKACSDIVALQEIYNKKHQEYVINELKSKYPYHFLKKGAGFKFDSGLMFLSKYPIADGAFHPFNENSFDEKIFVNKGFLSCDIFIKNFGKIHFINTHLTSGGTLHEQDSKKIIKIRNSQITQIHETLLKNNSPSVILGDFNTGPHIATSNYQNLINNGFVNSYSRSGLDNYTWDNTIYLNKIGTHSNSNSQRIDHIFLQNTLLKKVKILSSEIIFTESVFELNDNKIHLSDHFGIQTELILQ